MPKYLIFALLLVNFRGFGGTLLRGTRARSDQFPWLIQFHTISPCGGVLITPDWVLTAAQCVQHKRNSIVLHATGLNGTGSSQAVNVKATYIHSQFQGYSETRDHDYNIALLKLVKAFDMCDPKVRLLDIAPVRLDDDYKSCLIFGWQSTVAPSSKVHAKPIQYSRVLLNAWRLCLYMHKGNHSYRNVFCTLTEDENGMKACAGNPGSPVVCEDQNQRMVLLGIASWSNYSLDCGGLPTYLAVSAFRSWMWDLIFGHRNTEHWESGADEMGNAEQACKRQRHPADATHPISNIRPRTRNYTDREINRKKYASTGIKEQENGYPYKASWKSLHGQHAAENNKAGRMSSIAKDFSELHGDNGPMILFDEIDDYARILEPGDSQTSNIDVIREREEQLNQYREIGRIDSHLQDDAESEPIAVPSQHEKVAHIDDKFFKSNLDNTIAKDEIENSDVLELVMSDEMESFIPSLSTTFCDENLKILDVVLFSAVVNIFLS